MFNDDDVIQFQYYRCTIWPDPWNQWYISQADTVVAAGRWLLLVDLTTSCSSHWWIPIYYHWEQDSRLSESTKKVFFAHTINLLCKSRSCTFRHFVKTTRTIVLIFNAFVWSSKQFDHLLQYLLREM